MAEAIHAVHKGSNSHFVGVGNLRVMLVQDGELWFAQAMEIDYAAQGRTLQETQKNFEEGLRLTIHAHLREYQSIEKLLVPAPAETWTEFLKMAAAQRFRYTQVSIHQLGEEFAELKDLFGQIAYLEQKKAA